MLGIPYTIMAGGWDTVGTKLLASSRIQSPAGLAWVEWSGGTRHHLETKGTPHFFFAFMKLRDDWSIFTTNWNAQSFLHDEIVTHITNICQKCTHHIGFDETRKGRNLSLSRSDSMRSSQEEEKACVLVIPRSWDLDRQTKKRILAHVLSFNFSHKQSSQGAFITSIGKIQKKKKDCAISR